MKALRNLIIIIFAAVMLTIPFACKKKKEEPVPDPKPATGIIIAENTKMLDVVTRNAISKIDTTNFTFTFNSETDITKNFKVGDILVDSASEFSQYGYLRKITSIQSTKGETVITTEPAGLTEAILQGNIEFNSGKLKTSQIARMKLADGVKLKTLKNTDFTVFDLEYNQEIQFILLIRQNSLRCTISQFACIKSI